MLSRGRAINPKLVPMIHPKQSREIERTPSQAFRFGSADAVKQVLEEVEKAAEKRINDGFSEINFTLGVMNCFLVTYIFAAFPQHLWIIYVIEGLFLFPMKSYFFYKAKPLNQIYYLFDYCWIMNMVGVVALIVLVAGKHSLSESFRKELFLAAYGTACGPLFAATAVLPFISLIFHDMNSMTSVFIHFFPPLLFYILRWRSEEVLAAWPNAFSLDYTNDIQFWPEDSFTGNVFGNTIIGYLMWYIPYCVWIYFIGHDLPREVRMKKLKNGSPAPTTFDTVFHANHRNGNCVAMGTLFFNRSVEESKRQIANNDFETRDLVVYMAFHFLLVIASIVIVAYPCYLSRYVHGTFLVLLLIICTWRGAKRYTYYSTQMYARIIRSKFEANLRHGGTAFEA